MAQTYGERIKHVHVATQLEPMLNAVPLHRRVMLVRPIVDKKANSWKAPWTHRVSIFGLHWARALNHDRRFRPIKGAPFGFSSERAGVRAVVYERIRR